MHDFCVDEVIGSEFWVNSSELNFYEIQDLSFMPNEYTKLLPFTGEFKDKLISPINGYAKDFSPVPEIIDINKNTIRFRQKTHAEIWVEPKPNGLYALDKCHQRQFYPSKEIMHRADCFSARYKFYTPWILNTTGDISFVNTGEGDVFVINEKTFPGMALDQANNKRPDPIFIDFLIKKDGPHMHNDSYGIIDIGTPMYDFIVTLNDEEMEKLNV